MPETSPAPPPLAEYYAEAAPRLPGAGLDWLEELRRNGIETYCDLGLPNPKLEAWKYTNLNRLRRIGFTPAVLAEEISLDRIPAERILDVEGPVAVFVNGRLRTDLSRLDELPEGIVVQGFAEALRREPEALEAHLARAAGGNGRAMPALNAAFMEDGYVLRLAEGAALETPLHVVSLGAAPDRPLAFHPRNLILAGAGSRITIVESHVGLDDSPYLANAVTGIEIGAGATVHHYKLQNEAGSAFHIAATDVVLAERALYENVTAQLGGRLARNEIRVTLGAENATCRLLGVYAGRDDQHCDNTTEVIHAAPRCTSRQVYKGVLDDRARAVFCGKILVERDAQKSDGHQLSKTLLLAPGAEIDTKPELEIYADDVRCSHGATAGEIDEEQMFYLRARGIDGETARDLLVAAFLEEPLGEATQIAARDAIRGALHAWLGHRIRERAA